MLNSYLESNSKIIKKTLNFIYANGNDKELVNFGPIDFFSIFELTTSNGKHLEGTSHAHLVSLMYKLISSAIDSDDLFIGFDRSRDRRK